VAASAELAVDLAAKVLEAVLVEAASAYRVLDFLAWRPQDFDQYSITPGRECVAISAAANFCRII
jgi:hypothetical protein